MSRPQAEYDTDDPQPTPGPLRVKDLSVVRDDPLRPDEYWVLASFSEVAPQTPHAEGHNPEDLGMGPETARQNAKLYAAAGTAASELPDEYDAVAAVEALPTFIQKTESVTEHLSAVVEELLAVAQEEDAVDDAYAASKAADIIGEIESEVRKRLIPVLKSARGDTDE